MKEKTNKPTKTIQRNKTFINGFWLRKAVFIAYVLASFKFLEEELLCTSETNFIIIFNLLKFFSVTLQSYVLRISALDLLSNSDFVTVLL